MITRRKLLTGSAALAAYATLPTSRANANVNGTIPGAIRWDAWYGGTVNQAVSYSLSPSAYQSRAPWFATKVSPDIMTINGNQQATMDAEITYAASAGLKYWAYVWYGPADPMQNAWNLHQTSSIKNNMNWTLMLQFSIMGSFSANIATYVTYFQQANYQKVLTNRPIMYVFLDQLSAINNSPWNGSWAAVQTAFNALRTACTNAGLGSPYIILIGDTTGSIATQTSSDGLSGYNPPVTNTGAGTYASYDSQVQAGWVTMAGLGFPIILNTGTGWDQRPRFDRPVFFQTSQKPYFGRNNYYAYPNASQLTTSLQAAVSYVVANPTQCPSKAVLIYSWDECDEGGNAIIPAFNSANPAAPNTSVLNAVGAVAW